MRKLILLGVLGAGLALLIGTGDVEAKKKARKAPKDLPTLMAERGKVLLQEEFSGEALPEQWKTSVGKWEIEEDALKGNERPEDNHAGVIRTEMDCTNVIVQFSIMYKGGKGSSLSFNNKEGHVCRATFNPTGFGVNKDRPGKESQEEAKPLDAAKFEFKEGEWYDILVEIQGEEILASIGGDKRFVAFGSDPGIAKPKTNFGFTVTGEADQATYFDDLRVWEAQPSKKWEKTRKTLEAAKEYMTKQGLR